MAIFPSILVECRLTDGCSYQNQPEHNRPQIPHEESLDHMGEKKFMRLIKQLPDPFQMQSGTRVGTAQDWQRRRDEIKQMMLNVQYGTMPGAPERVEVKALETEQFNDGKTCEKLHFEFISRKNRPDVSFGVSVNLWRPSDEAVAERRHTINGFGQEGLPALIYVGMGMFPNLLDHGIMMICYQNNQLEPMEEGNPIVGPARKAYEELEPGKYSWGSISVWAWGALRLLDYLLAMPDVNKEQIMVSGHSRNGKTALLAGALDERIALVNPAGSGCAGAASYLALGDGCEDLAALTDRKRWWAWTHAEFDTWVGREEELPLDQHFLMGLVAPRPLLRTEGTTDHWANPKGTCAAFLATQPIYDYLGVSERNGIYFHEGGHHQGEEDIDALLAFSDWHFFGTQPEHSFSHIPYEESTFPTIFHWAHP